MTVNPLVFSNNPRYRIARHSLFWLLWILYYSIFGTLYWQDKYSLTKSFFSSLVEVVLSTPLDMVFCYAIIYYLLPTYLYRGRYIKMTLLWILLSLFYILAYRSYYYYIVPHIRQSFGMPPPSLPRNAYWAFLNLFYQVNMEGGLAAAIKLGKMWFIKQQELDLIKKGDPKASPRSEDGKMHPVFLIDALDRVERLSVIKPSLIPGMVKRIKSLLLYVIYENNQANVSLEKELTLLEEYVELEKSGIGENLRVVVKIIGNTQHERIAPFIILPLVGNGFRQLARLELPNKFIELEIRVADGELRMKIAWSKPIDSSTLTSSGNLSLQSIGKRLDLLYPQSHDLRVIITTDQFIIDLTMDLRRAIN
jgi:Histidine kinase